MKRIFGRVAADTVASGRHAIAEAATVPATNARRVSLGFSGFISGFSAKNAVFARCLLPGFSSALSTKRESGIEGSDQLVYVLLCRIEHHPRSYNIPVKPAFADQDALSFSFFEYLQQRFRCRLLGLAVLDQFDTLHQAHAADVADDGVFVL